MKILGIDPGLHRVGWSILSSDKNDSVSYISSGVIITNQKDHVSIRLAKIYKDLSLLVENYSPDFAALEEIFINKNARSSLALGFARGAILTCLGSYNLTLEEYAPNKIKKTIVGSGKADKEQVMKMIKLVINDANFSSNDEADAIAIAYTGAVNLKNLAMLNKV